MHRIESLLPTGGVSGETKEPDDIARGQAEPNLDAPVQLHWTIRRLDTPGVMTYGGLHEAREDAQAALDARIDDERIRLRNASQSPHTKEQFSLMQGSVESWKNNTEIIYLNSGEQFSPWGVGRKHHGVDDGTHGSPVPGTWMERHLLLGEE